MHCFTAKNLKTDIYLVSGEILNFPEFFLYGGKHSAMQIFLIFQESKLVLYLYDRNCLYRNWAKYGLYKYILVILPLHCRKIKIDFWLSIRAMFFMALPWNPSK